MDRSCADHPYVSIIVCTLGLRPSLLRCLESLAAQSCARSEILVVLNREENIPMELPTLAIPVRLLHEPRRGVCAARNRAIPEARGEILVFVDDDVVTHASWLHGLLEGFADPQVACITGRVIPSGPAYSAGAEAHRLYFGAHLLFPRNFDCTPGWYNRALSFPPMGFGCNMAFRKSFLTACTGFPEDLGAGAAIEVGDEDYMFLQVLKRGFRVHYTPDAVVTHIFEDNLETRRARAKQIRAGILAFKLKLLVEEKAHRMATLRNLLGAATRWLRASLRKPVALESGDLLSPLEKLQAYWRGLQLFQRVRKSPQPRPKS